MCQQYLLKLFSPFRVLVLIPTEFPCRDITIQTVCCIDIHLSCKQWIEVGEKALSINIQKPYSSNNTHTFHQLHTSNGPQRTYAAVHL